MAITNYHTVNGEIIGETTGSVRTGYLSDCLGSVTATQGSTGSVLATYRYKPYGALLAKTGAGSDPRFLWTGVTPSRVTSLSYAEQYNRVRHLSTTIGQWTGRDALWPTLKPYAYAWSNPTTYIDPFGLAPIAISVSAFINRNTHGPYLELSKLWSFSGAYFNLFGVGLYSGTDRAPYNRTGSNRGRFDVGIDSLGIGYGGPAKKQWIGLTEVFVKTAGFYLPVYSNLGHQYLYSPNPDTGWTACKNSWLRVHARWCAALVPNLEEACIDHRYTIVFELVRRGVVRIIMKDSTLDKFPDADAWVYYNGRFHGNWFHLPEDTSGYAHPFIGLAFTRSFKAPPYELAAETPPPCFPISTGTIGAT